MATNLGYTGVRLALETADEYGILACAMVPGSAPAMKYLELEDNDI